ncbi:hypothetical protein P5673_007182 [Acropora cervicornis]|uniref:Uncharacterized protein n=1 Tax=Acropora cervicornis TaxID=6130 RepID=A0AAD9VBU3_ACRCE|nr:hypothetical protein P5673_007182 [Acropora cervicornis]
MKPQMEFEWWQVPCRLSNEGNLGLEKQGVQRAPLIDKKHATAAHLSSKNIAVFKVLGFKGQFSINLDWANCLPFQNSGF